MTVADLESSSSQRALRVALAPKPRPAAFLVSEPAWIARAADDCGYAWARIAWQRAAAQPGAWFDAAKADAVVALWPKVFRLTAGRFAGKPFQLRFWQEVIVRLLTGWKVPIDVVDEETGIPTTLHVRLYRELRLWIARKNGKSEFLAALALLFWALEGEVRGQGFCFAHDENQARVVFDKIADMIAYQPALAKDTRMFSRALWIQTIKASFRLLSGKAKGKHGRGATVTVGDEMHEWKSRELADTMRQSEAGSLQPIRLYASTASPEGETVGNELYEESLKILDGRIDDPSTLVVLFQVPDDADWNDERVWGLANPSLGLSPTLHHLREEHRKALGNPRAEAQFRCYHLNQVVAQYARWLPLPKWDRGYGGPKWDHPDAGWRRMWEEMAGRACTLAFDSTQSFDPACLCLRFAPDTPEGKVRYLWKFWMPADTIRERTAAESMPFDRWRDAGAIEEIPGGTFVIDYAVVAARRAVAQFKVVKIGYDGWNALDFYNSLVMGREHSLVPGAADVGHAPLPEDMVQVLRFGHRTLGLASNKFEGEVRDGLVDHGGHPMARWMAGHCLVRFDENMGVVPAKKRSVKSIDGIVAAVMAKALALAPEPPRSVWDVVPVRH